MIDICPICQIATPCDCDDHEETNVGKLMYAGAKMAKRIGELEADGHQLHRFVARLASMPMSHENLQSTWCPPEYDDIKDWWDQFIDEARNITGVSYRGK